MELSEHNMLDELMDSFAGCLDSASLLRFSEVVIPEAVQERMSQLASKANEGALTEDELTSYEAAINAADIMAILKLKAQQRVAASTRP